MSGLLRKQLLGLAGILALASWADDRDVYERLGTTLIYSEDVSNDEVNRLVATGVASDDPEIVELTLDAIGVMANSILIGMELEALDMLYRPSAVHTWPKRALAEVPRLKGILIRHFDLSNEDWLREKYAFEIGEIGDDLDMRKPMAGLPGWSFIPAVLALNWPGDADVERFLLDRPLPMLDTSFAKTRKVLLLNAGRFTSAEANAVRQAVLSDDSIGRNVHMEFPGNSVPDPQELAALAESSALEMQRQARLHALLGLALSRSPEAIPQLIALGIDRPYPAILESLDRYDDAELMPYRQDLNRMLSTMRQHFFSRDDLPETHARLEDFRSRFGDAPSGAPR